MKISFFGIGLMGRPMAIRLKDAGHQLIVFDRHRPKAEALRAQGVAIADSHAQALQESVCVILMLSDAEAVRNALLNESARAELHARTVIQMGTISPVQSKELRRLITDARADYLEAPVLGNVPEAEQGKLIVMVGATPDQFKRWEGILKVFGPKPMRVGGVGQAAALKLAMNQLIASLMTGFALSLGLVEREDIDVDVFMQLLRDSALYAPAFDKKLPRMRERRYSSPDFPTKHLLKDIELCLEEAAKLKLQLSTLEAMRGILLRTLDLGLAESDYSALYDAVNPPE
jgi:3-hydroxyisobutyrate dehydrogenase and related beta-hydroxyacid dehydrogenases